MCGITQLHCDICKSTCNHLFYPCESFLEESLNFQGQTLKPTKHFHCPELKWPLDPSVGLTRWICEGCIEDGRKYYEWSLMAERAKDTSDRQYRLLDNRLASELEAADRDRDVFRHLAPALKVQSEDMKMSVMHKFYTNREVANKFANPMATEEEKTKAIADYWFLRSSQATYRSLTLWIPCCRLCRHPTVTAQDVTAIADIEFQPNEILWKWLVHLKEETLIQTEIRTGFMSTICDSCVDQEHKMRRQVSQFLDRYPGNNGVAWAVYYWSLTRGSHEIPMFEHATHNLGFPTKDAPPLREILKVMAESWKRMNGGMEWADTVDLPAPVSCTIPLYIHDKPFTSFDQWESLAMTVQANTMTSRKQNPVHGGSNLMNAGSLPKNAMANASILNLAQPILEELGCDPKAMAQLQKQSGLSRDWLQRNVRAAIKILGHISKMDAGSEQEADYVPLEVEVSSRRGLPGRKPTKTKKQKADATARSLVTVRGVCIREDKVMRIPCVDAHASGSAVNGDVNGSLSYSAEMHNGIKSTKSGNRQATSSSRDKHVHFALASTTDSDNSQTAGGEDVDMKDAEADGQLSPNEAIFLQCDKGGIHLVDYEGTRTGDMIYFPLMSKPLEETYET